MIDLILSNWIILLFWFFAGLFIGEQETIWTKYAATWIKGDWWNKNFWKYSNPFWQFMFRYPLSFMKDGYHFTKSLAQILIAISVTIALQLNFWESVVFVILLYTVIGSAFNISYHDIL